jgi:1,2-diacylglycerol 3-alpha-glucosyltransferase
MQATKVLLVCPGLGHIVRGYETFTRECFDALFQDDRLDLHLFKGAGPRSDHEYTLWCLRRNRPLARIVGGLLGRDAYYVEQSTFALALLTQLSRLNPDVIYFSDGAVGNLLWRWRRLGFGKFKLLLSNGGPLGPPAFPRIDHVHQVSEIYYEESTRAGRPPQTQTLLPYGIGIESRFHPQSPDLRDDLRRSLGLPVGRPVVLSVGAVNHSHKRMDYVVREIASLPEPRPYLLLLGNLEPESPPIIRLGNELLGPDGFRALTVPQAMIDRYYQAADLFVLASLKEGFGRVYVEALARGLPCIAHDYPVARSVLGDCGLYGNLRFPGALAALINGIRPGDQTDEQKQARHRSVRDRFSWEFMREKYVSMILRCTKEPIPQQSLSSHASSTKTASTQGTLA